MISALKTKFLVIDVLMYMTLPEDKDTDQIWFKKSKYFFFFLLSVLEKTSAQNLSQAEISLRT